MKNKKCACCEGGNQEENFLPEMTEMILLKD